MTDYLAIYAAVLSTIVFLWNVLQSRPRIKVDLVFGIEDKDGKIKSGVYVFVRNLSSHDVYLANINVLYPYKKVSFKEQLMHAVKYRRVPRRSGWVHASLDNYSVESGCPVRLESRKSHQVLIPDAVVEEMLETASQRRLIACVQDQLWNEVYSRPLKWVQ